MFSYGIPSRKEPTEEEKNITFVDYATKDTPGITATTPIVRSPLGTYFKTETGNYRVCVADKAMSDRHIRAFNCCCTEDPTRYLRGHKTMLSGKRRFNWKKPRRHATSQQYTHFVKCMITTIDEAAYSEEVNLNVKRNKRWNPYAWRITETIRFFKDHPDLYDEPWHDNPDEYDDDLVQSCYLHFEVLESFLEWEIYRWFDLRKLRIPKRYDMWGFFMRYITDICPAGKACRLINNPPPYHWK